MKTSPLTVEEKESIREVTICIDRLIFCFSVFFSIHYFFHITVDARG